MSAHPHSPERRGPGRAGGGRLRVRRVRAAALAGHPSYSANLSVNATIRKQQLICDPFGSIYSGSMSTLYQPGLVSLSGASPADLMIHPVTGFHITASYVEVRPFSCHSR